MYVSGIDSLYSVYYTYDKTHRLTSETKGYRDDSNKKTKYYYDPNGNLISKAYSTDKKSTQLISLTMLSANAVGSGTYEYDGFNRLTESHEAGATYSYSFSLNI